MNVTEFTTRKSLMDSLMAQGVTGLAAEVICRETTSFRHRWRKSQAETAAQSWAKKVCPLHGSHQQELLARFLVVLDAAGTGGIDGIEGRGTLRVPAFRSLGKGRKQATDGQAWDAAIAESLSDVGRVTVSPVGEGEYLCVSNGVDDGSCAVISVRVLKTEGLGPQVLTLLREGLRLSVGLPFWLSRLDGGYIGTDAVPTVLSGSSADWAELLNLFLVLPDEAPAEKESAA
jgi:hypothetical protein